MDARHDGEARNCLEARDPAPDRVVIIKRDAAVAAQGDVWETGDVGDGRCVTDNPVGAVNFPLCEMVVENPESSPRGGAHLVDVEIVKQHVVQPGRGGIHDFATGE